MKVAWKGTISRRNLFSNQHVSIVCYWPNYYNSLTWIKGILRGFPYFLTAAPLVVGVTSAEVAINCLDVSVRMRFHVKHWLVQYDPCNQNCNQFFRGYTRFKKSDSKTQMGNHHLGYIRSNPLPSNSKFSGKWIEFPATIILSVEFSGTFRSDDVTLLAPSCLPLCLEDPDMTWNNGQWKTLRSPRRFTGSI